MNDEKIKSEEQEELDLDLDTVEPIDLEIDDDIVDIEDDSSEKEESVGIQIKTREKKHETDKSENSEKEDEVSEKKELKSENSEEPSDVDETQALIDELNATEPKSAAEVKAEIKEEAEIVKQDALSVETNIFALRTTANREDQVVDFLTSNAEKKKFAIYSIIRPHGMRGYVFVEAESRDDVDQAIQGVPYARGLLPSEIQYEEIEHMLEQVKKDVNIKQNDIVEIISGPFKRENAKIIRVDKSKEDVVVELLEAAVPIPITLKMDSVKVIRRETGDDEE